MITFFLFFKYLLIKLKKIYKNKKYYILLIEDFMTDLNLAYGFLDEPQLEQQNFMNQKDIDSINTNNNIDYNIEKNNIDNIQVEKPKKKKNMNTEILEDRPVYQRHKENYNISNANNNNDNIPIPDYPYNKKNTQNKHDKYDQYENTFWNRFTNKKNEVFKLIMFSLVILFAISLDRIATHYLSKYVNENVLTDNQELIIRIAYPVLIILILWIFKAI